MAGRSVEGEHLEISIGSGSYFALLLYPSLGWLFGSYTVLRWRRLALPVLLQRLLITASTDFCDGRRDCSLVDQSCG